ncbi:hypothetical protein HYV80_06635 [Candidatus Woesearchaeota archaeon]|nr:hypothetical protein [Candidatus Woesearchaeota archaeon]
MGTSGTIDDVVDPALSRLQKGFKEFEDIGRAFEPHLSRFIGKKADSGTAEDIVKALYDSHDEHAPLVADVLGKHGINSKDYDTTIAQYGIPREELKRAITQSKSGVVDSDVIRQIGTTVAARYFGKTMESEPTRLTNLADKVGVSKVVDILKKVISTLYGEIALKAEDTRLKGIKTVQDVGQFAGRLYNGALDSYRSAYAR